MIEGYDDYRERMQRGLSAYTLEGLVKKIDDQQKDIDDLHNQIATLKASLIRQVAQENFITMCRLGVAIGTDIYNPYEDAKKRLARELPEIDWSDWSDVEWV